MRAGFPLPDVNWEPTRGFWQAAQRRELQMPRCERCGLINWYPPPRCRACECESLGWSSLSGRATLFSWSHVSRALFDGYASKAPYITGLVALEEDPRVRLVTLLVDCLPEDLTIDMPVEVVFRVLEFPDVEGSVIAPMFRPHS
ncbi:MAG: OB-fold domain-containing protein [Deltaproteobacteria bacterium]|nr:OB-fold domain-containing protein [Deltaproteobacteria bacterium]MBW2698341.1 OB-fold domain-containing protein [Deltaproteobacteria bacterium]